MPSKKRPIKIGSDQFQALQDKWYGKLKDAGFTDIERGKDLAQFPGTTTLPHGHISLDSFELDRENAQRLFENLNPQDLAETDRYVFWSDVSAAVQKLPTMDPDRPFLEEYAKTGKFSATRRNHGLTKKKAHGVIWRFLDMSGIPRPKAYRHPSEKTKPGPVRVLSREEIDKEYGK